MSIRFRCTKCLTPLEASVEVAGIEVECPRCRTQLTVPQSEIGPGSILGGFRIERLIGEGGMGQVYLAKQLSMDRDVAVKVLRRGPGFTEQDAHDFLREVRLLARLDHPNIVTAHEAGEAEGVLFLAMTYVRGDPVERRIARDGPMPESEVLRIGRRVAEALEYAWNEHRVLHRDIKPSNILLDSSGEPRLADLGLAQSLLHEGQRLSDIEGTPNYMSPEQAEGVADADCRSDIYALGASLYHMLTAHLPFAAATVEETLRLKATQPLEDPRVYRPELSSHTVELLTGMLATEPGDRYATWEDVRRAMDRVVSGHAPQPTHETAAAAAHTGVRVTAAQIDELHHAHHHGSSDKHRAFLLAAVGLIVIGGAAVLVRSLLDRPLPVTPPVAEQPPVTTPTPDPTSDPEAEAKAAAEREQALAAEREQAAQNKLKEAEAWAAQNSANFDGVLDRLAALREEVKGTPAEAALDARIAHWTEVKVQAIAAVMNRLGEQTRPMIERGEYEAAALKMESYVGALAGDTAGARSELAAQFRRTGEEHRTRALEKARAEWEKARAELAGHILNNDPAAAASLLAKARASAETCGAAEEAESWDRLVRKIQEFDGWIIQTFQEDIGKTMELGSGREAWTIIGIQGKALRLRRDLGGAFTERSITAADIPLPERYRRLSTETPPVQGHLQAWFHAAARLADRIPALLKDAEDPVSRALSEAAGGKTVGEMESRAQMALNEVLRRARIPSEAGETPANFAARVRRTTFDETLSGQLKPVIRDFRARFANTQIVSDWAEALEALENTAPWPREIDPRLVENSMSMMAQLNPGFRPELAEWKTSLEGVELILEGRMISNITPLETLPLTALTLRATSVRDLSALRSMPLFRLDVSQTPIRDFSPLRSRPLRELIANGCTLDSLSTLRGLSLQSLSISTNSVSGLSPLTGMPLQRFVASNCPITSLTTLSRMPLEYLDISHTTEALDLKPLRSTPLKTLILSRSRVTDLSGLKGLPLETLYIDQCHSLPSLGTLPADLPLKFLSAQGLTEAAILSLPTLSTLEALDVSQGRSIANPNFLRGLRLKELWMNHTSMTELGILIGMPLERLHLRDTPVIDIGPLANLPLKYLNLRDNARLKDIAPLADCEELETLILPGYHALPDDAVLKLPKLQKIGLNESQLLSPAEFKKKYLKDRAAP
ncbi:MAG: protein kinase [Kiritimatiellae bacterium]|nr:protein kinase [Kiritimatiellia bacterium]